MTLFLPKDRFNLIFSAVDVEFAQRRVGVTSAEHESSSSTSSSAAGAGSSAAGVNGIGGAFEFDAPLTATGEVPAKPADVTAALVAAVGKNPLLAQLDPEQKAAVVAAMRRAKVAEGAAVITQGEPGAHLFIIDQGVFTVQKNGKTVGKMGPGTVFGELALLYNAPRAATVTATEASSVWIVDRFTFRKISRNIAESTIKKVAAFLQVRPCYCSLTKNIRLYISHVG